MSGIPDREAAPSSDRHPLPPHDGGASALPAVSFVVPVRNDARRLQRCLATIRANDYPAHLMEIVVADNGSTDDSVDVARESGAVVLHLPDLRVGTLRNRAAAEARGSIVAFVDADHEIDRGWVAAAVDTLQQPSVAAAGALCDPPENGTWVQKTYGALRGRVAGQRDVDWLGSGNLAMWKTAFEQEGGFDTTLETCEDVDLCQRLRRRGLRIVSDARLRSVHLGDPATLMALFRGELWRGRDNLRASFRGPLNLRSLPSVVIPVLELFMLAIAIAGLAALPLTGVRVTAAALGVLTFLVALRTARIVMRTPGASPADIAQAFAVAAVYDLARAIALIARGSHKARAQTATA
jgi:hypothetical protein